MPGSDLGINVEHSGRVVRVSVRGELDLANAEQLHHELTAVIAHGAEVRLDLSGVSFMDVAGARVLLSAHEDSRRDGWSLRLEPGLASQVRRLIELLPISELLDGSG